MNRSYFTAIAVCMAKAGPFVSLLYLGHFAIDKVSFFVSPKMAALAPHNAVKKGHLAETTAEHVCNHASAEMYVSYNVAIFLNVLTNTFWQNSSKTGLPAQ